MSNEKKLDCTINFGESASFIATAHLLEDEYGSRYTFWYGVAQIVDLNVTPSDLAEIVFEDGRRGVASIRGGEVSGGDGDVAFMGISPLK